MEQIPDAPWIRAAERTGYGESYIYGWPDDDEEEIQAELEDEEIEDDTL
jgi:hypothetical protein